MAEVKSQDSVGARHEEETTKPDVEPVTADWRVEEAVKTRWHSITENPKIIMIALFASYVHPQVSQLIES